MRLLRMRIVGELHVHQRFGLVHAHAQHVQLDVRLGEAEAHLTLRDDGVGFDTETLAPQAASTGRGYGLQGLRERLELVRGQMRITSDARGGTELIVVIPRYQAQVVAA